MRSRTSRKALFLFLTGGALLLGGFARADTIVLKNGRRIIATQVVEENGRVSAETPAGRLSLPRSIVERIERGGGPATSFASGRAAELPLAPPPLGEIEGYDEIARAAVHDGGVDREYLARLEAAAQGRGKDSAAVARVAAALNAVAQFELGRGDLDQAIANYRHALTFAPDQVSLLLNVAYLHLRRSEYSASLDYLDRARRVAPDSADVAKLAGWAYYGLNHLERAVAEWKRAQQIRPDAEVQRALEKAERDLQTESNFREGETSHFTLRYSGAETPGLAREVLRALEAHFNDLQSELDFTPAEPIGVILYTRQAFADITRAPGWVGAVNDGRIRVPVQGLVAMSPELSRVLKHELTHSFLQQKTRGRCPVWLQEGMAQWMEGRRSAAPAGSLVAAYERKAALPLSSLEGTWMNLPGGVAAYAYAWSLAVVEYMIAAGGMSDLGRLLERIAAEGSAESAAREVLRVDYAELEQETITYLRRRYLQ